MEFFLLWVFVSIEKIAAFLAIGGSIFTWSAVAYVMCYVVNFLASKDQESFKSISVKMKLQRRLAVIGIVFGAILFTTGSLLPNKKELAIIVGGGMTYQMLTSDTAKEIGGKAVELLKKQIDDALKGEKVEVIKKEAVDQVKNGIRTYVDPVEAKTNA